MVIQHAREISSRSKLAIWTIRTSVSLQLEAKQIERHYVREFLLRIFQPIKFVVISLRFKTMNFEMKPRYQRILFK